DGNGETVEIPTGKAHRVISRRASSTVMDMMESVVTLAPDRQVPGYRTAGKTGTAERIDPSCHCYRGYTASYVTVGPVEDPRILTYVVINNPSKGSHQGSGIALPVGRQIMSVALPQFGVPPSRTKASKKPLEYTP
ncbi:MAG: penicillin-binding transpeptidase domain-containing protein, partial [Propionibacterium sp.]|nr:penicillin-binding transpeptidase domain-containing protein [Propionibacterium sp.]